LTFLIKVAILLGHDEKLWQDPEFTLIENHTCTLKKELKNIFKAILVISFNNQDRPGDSAMFL